MDLFSWHVLGRLAAPGGSVVNSAFLTQRACRAPMHRQAPLELIRRAGPSVRGSHCTLMVQRGFLSPTEPAHWVFTTALECTWTMLCPFLAVLCHGPRFQVIDLRPIFFQPITAKVVIGAKKAYRGHRAQGSCCDDSRDSAEARKRLLGRWLGERCPRNQQSGVPAARTCAMSRYAVPSAGGKSRARSAKMNA